MVVNTFSIGKVTIEFFILGMLENNVYIISKEGASEVLLVDPSCQAERIMQVLEGRKVGAIMLTHSHADHCGAAAEMRRLTEAPVVASKIDAPFIEDTSKVGRNIIPPAENCVVDCPVEDGQEYTVGGLTWKVMVTPGHSEGSMCWFLPADQTDGQTSLLLSGDTLFAGCTGRTDFERGSEAQMQQSLKVLATLPDDTVVLPGHNRLTEIGMERGRVFASFR